jgi:RNA 3'-phosphate cyclase
MLVIDGSYQEGGGQIIRTALALSVLTQKPFRAVKIRQKRPKPGLKYQHLSCIQALKKLSDARVDGARLGSQTIEVFPGPANPGILALDIGTAGSITLLLQSLLLPAAFAGGRVELKLTGGTDTKWSMPLDYFERVVLPVFEDLATFRIQATRRGYYPKGQGLLNLTITPRVKFNKTPGTDELIRNVHAKIPSIHLTAREKLFEIKGRSSASQQLKSADVSRRQAQGARRLIGDLCPVTIKEEYMRTASIGTVITLWANFHNTKVRIGADALGKKGVPAEKIGEAAAVRLLDYLDSDAVVDPHLADNIIPLLALIGGSLKTTKITGHILSNIYVCEKFLNVRFTIDSQKNLITVN